MAKIQKYDSTKDTVEHVEKVRWFIDLFIDALYVRGIMHDSSKLGKDEKPIFDKYTPKLKGCTYGSPEYKRYLKEMQVALDHHYAVNSHHPEHHTLGVQDMTLVDLVEMFCDWWAASQRHADGDIRKSIEFNRGRFDMAEIDMASIFLNTLQAMEGELKSKRNKLDMMYPYFSFYDPEAIDGEQAGSKKIIREPIAVPDDIFTASHIMPLISRVCRYLEDCDHPVTHIKFNYDKKIKLIWLNNKIVGPGGIFSKQIDDTTRIYLIGKNMVHRILFNLDSNFPIQFLFSNKLGKDHRIFGEKENELYKEDDE